MVTLGEFLAAERQQESGGDYSIVNSSSGALGAYQVMPANLPSWTQQALGRVDTPAQYLASRSDQDAVAEKILGGYFNRYGPAGAAAEWYSGQPDPTKTYGSPPVYQYVRDVLAKIGSSGTVTSGGGGSTGATQADNVTGSTVTTAGLQQAGYDAVIDLTPWGIPLNPFKLPGWLAGKLGGLTGGSGTGGITGGLADSLGPMLLAGLGVTTGAVLLVLGAFVAVKPTLDSALDEAGKASAANAR